MTLPDFSRLTASPVPFPHFQVSNLVTADVATAALAWLDERADWNLRIEEFYQQHEVDLLSVDSPLISPLVSSAFVAAVRDGLSTYLPTDGRLYLVGVSAHRLTQGQTIRLHNDDVGTEESHRLLLQLNAGWRTEQGGLLMLFSDNQPETLSDVILPVHASGFGFRISASSHHAVSTVHEGQRFTVVYTFRQVR